MMASRTSSCSEPACGWSGDRAGVTSSGYWHSTPERESQVTVVLQPDGDGTLLTLTHEQLFDQAARDGHERGWRGSLDKLENYLA